MPFFSICYFTRYVNFFQKPIGSLATHLGNSVRSIFPVHIIVKNKLSWYCKRFIIFKLLNISNIYIYIYVYNCRQYCFDLSGLVSAVKLCWERTRPTNLNLVANLLYIQYIHILIKALK